MEESILIPDFDSTIIPAYIDHEISGGKSIECAAQSLLNSVVGSVTAIVHHRSLRKFLLISNCRNLFYLKQGKHTFVSSERYFLESVFRGYNACLVSGVISFDVSRSLLISHTAINFKFNTSASSTESGRVTLPKLISLDEGTLIKRKLPISRLRRCSKCILPETMPFIRFNSDGVCNYCTSYQKKQSPPQSR